MYSKNIVGLGGVGRKPTISEIKRITMKKSPYFFSRDTMKFFNQKMSDYKVERSPKGRIFIYAPMFDYDYRTGKKRKMGYTFREFKNKDLKSVKGRYENLYDINEYIQKN